MLWCSYFDVFSLFWNFSIISFFIHLVISVESISLSSCSQVTSKADTALAYTCTCMCLFNGLSLFFPLLPARLSFPFGLVYLSLSLSFFHAALSARYGSPKRQLQFYRYLFVCWLISHGHLILHSFSFVLESTFKSWVHS